MDRQTEERWRAALAERGKERVQAELEMIPGRPEDLVYTLGDAPPYPTRAFCEQWCRGKPAQRIGGSGTTAILIGLTVVMVLCFLAAANSLVGTIDTERRAGPSPGQRGAVLAPFAGSGFKPDDATRNQALTPNAGKGEPSAENCSAVTSAGNLRTVPTAKPCLPPGLPSALHHDQSANHP
jgi:hypothetical protein